MNLAGLWQGIWGGQSRADAEQERAAAAELEAQVAAAHREWQAALHHFQMVSEPDLVDHAIFHLEAAQRKYMYLLNLVRQRRQQSTAGAGQAPWM